MMQEDTDVIQSDNNEYMDPQDSHELQEDQGLNIREVRFSDDASGRQPEETNLPPKCDRFVNSKSDKSINEDTNVCYEISRQILKIVVYILTFAIVLISAMIAKGTLLFMTSQIRPGQTTPYCDTLHSNLQSYQAVLGLQEQAQWIWVIFFAFITPEFFTLLRSVRLITFKTFDMPTMESFFLTCLFETSHTVGVAILAFVVLPELDVVKGLMLTNCLCIVPGVLMPLSRAKGGADTTNTFLICIILDGLAIVSQLSGLVVWPILEYQKLRNAVWAIPVGIILTSMGWWENYIEENSTFHIVRRLNEIKEVLSNHRTRYVVYAIVSLWKMLVFFCSMTAFVYLTATQDGEDGFFIFKYFITFNSSRPIEIQPTNVSNHIYLNPQLDGSISEVVQSASDAQSFSIQADGKAAIAVWGIQIAAAYVCYITSKFACRVQIQGFSFAIPITLTVPTAISLLIIGCGMKNADVCYMKYVIPRYLFWECPPQEFFTNFIVDDYAWIWFFWFLSQVWITFHIWVPKNERLACTEKIFLNPMYDAILVDQSVVLNRRRDDGEGNEKDNNYRPLNNHENDDDTNDSNVEFQEPQSEDDVPTIIPCITMWHESEKEMLTTLVSLMRLDRDQCERRLTKRYIDPNVKDYYKMEGHIFMDDAIKYDKITKKPKKLNKYVRCLISVMDEAAKRAYSNLDIVPKLDKPAKYKTPYGCRLVYKLLGGNELYIHLKDIKLIRNRKRWSQVMYMYYLLGMKLGSLDIDVNIKDLKLNNTFLLALDGDIEFQPEAVLLLVDLMKKNDNLGAACGRIHPVGSGSIAWYQKFEYAISHWLQKATEHVIGCVLCSPGCFSLFRAQALCQVMDIYTTMAKEARHYVQYDQGEDRWLCTLLLQQSYRVEYAAAADAYTHCPESFKEFYNQRKRWVPSTMANIMDLLENSKQTIKNNDDISIVYIIYQIVLMVSAIIGPGTIFLMILGSMVAAFGIDNWTSMWMNIILVLIFILVCLLCKQNVQIKVAGVLTCIYALLMMAVLVGIFLEIAAEGWLAPSSFFLLMTAGLMIVTALLHPKEMSCLLFGVIYWIVIPSMYLLLIIYSVMNMYDISWGVRESSAKENKKVTEVTVQQKETKDNMGQKTLKALGLSGANEDDGEFCGVSCGNLWTLRCCTNQKTEAKDEAVEKLANLINGKLDSILQQNTTERRRSLFLQPGPSTRHDDLNAIEECQECDDLNAVDQGLNAVDQGQNRDDSNNQPNAENSKSLERNVQDSDAWIAEPSWFTDIKMQQKVLDPEEVEQWKHIIEKYLFPLMKKHENKNMKKDLKGLRNQTALAFFMLNALFVVTVFLMQVHQDTIYIEYPYMGHVNISWNADGNEVQIHQEMLRLEPIGFVLIIIFAGIMLIQFIAMLFHRFGTISLILATTKITICSDEEQKRQEGLINIAKKMLGAREPDDTEEVSGNQRRHSRREPRNRRNTFHVIETHFRRRQNTTGDIEEAFLRRLTNPNIQREGHWMLRDMNREAADLVRRRSMAFHRASQASLSFEVNDFGNYETPESCRSDDSSQEPEYNAAQPIEGIAVVLEQSESTTL